MKPSKQALKKKVEEKEGGCWSIGEHLGYNVMTVDGEARNAHRVFYEVFVGKVPDGKNLHNTCRHKWCVNPKHWQPKTPGEAIRASIKARGETDIRSQVAKWMDAKGITSEDLAELAGQSKAAAHVWRQGSYPNKDAEQRIRAQHPDFPERIAIGGTI